MQCDSKDITVLLQPLMFAAIENNLSLMERLVAQGCSVNKKNKEGYIALHFGNTILTLTLSIVSILLCPSCDVLPGRHGVLAAGPQGRPRPHRRAQPADLPPPGQRPAQRPVSPDCQGAAHPSSRGPQTQR